MKKICALGLIFGFSTLFSAAHYPSISMEIDPFNKDLSLKYHHQTVFDIQNGHFVAIHGLFNPLGIDKHHSHIGFSFKKHLVNNLKIGANLSYALTNKFGQHAHQISPGFDIDFGIFNLAFNHYVPLRQKLNIAQSQYKFHNVSEVILSTKPHELVDISGAGLFNFEKKSFGCIFSCLFQFHENWNVGVHPYYFNKQEKGMTISFGFSLGSNPAQTIKKSHGFFHTHKKSPLKKETPSVVHPLREEPVNLPPKEEKAPEPEKKVEVNTDIIIPTPIQPAPIVPWYQRLFFWR